MALAKSIPTPFAEDLVAAYWRVEAMTYDANQSTLDLTIAGYPAAKDRTESRPPLLTLRRRIESVVPEVATVAQAYGLLKTDPEFAGALDA